METAIETPANCFPMAKARSSQVAALDFIWTAMLDGYEDIVVSAPTGIGKTGIGAALCLWGGTLDIQGYKHGGYYLVTQKMLQDQLERDFPRFGPEFFNKAACLKSSNEYPCPTYTTCGMGSRMKDTAACEKRKGINKSCPYVIQRRKFEIADLAVTNYPFFFTEHVYVNKLEPRIALVADECHTLEKQITGFVEVCVNKDTLSNWAPHLKPRSMPKMEDFVSWLEMKYLTALDSRLQMVMENLQASGYKNRRLLDEHNKLENHIGRTKMAVSAMRQDPKEWVYWQEEVKGELQSTAKPISAAPFVPKLVQEMAATRLYMSAYPGPKDVFCRSLGLEQSKVAWLDLDSNFPVAHRPVHIWDIGSMGRASIEQSFPSLCKVANLILEAHKEHKGIIHCHSYGLGTRLYQFFQGTSHRQRVLFPTKASDRRYVLERHATSKEPTVILSPSIAEGYSFDDDLARFQIVAKMPYPYLGDKQVAARKNQDPEWYVLQTVMTIIQACGRIVRSDTDYGDTYILDSDFKRLYSENGKFFPKWFRESFQFVK